MKKFHVRVRSGNKALMMHKFSVETAAGLESKVKKRSTGAPDAKVEAESGAYRLEAYNGDPLWTADDAPLKEMIGQKKGALCLPSEHFYESMGAAASSFKIQGQRQKTYKDAIRGNCEIQPDFVPLMDPSTGQKLYDYDIDSRPVRIQRNRVMRRRPLIRAWAAEFDIVIFDAEEVPDEIVHAVLSKAGQAKGVGDYRPRFGGFLVEVCKLVESDEPERTAEDNNAEKEDEDLSETGEDHIDDDLA